MPGKVGRPRKHNPEDAETEAIHVATKWEYKPILIGFIISSKRENTDEEGLPTWLSDQLSKNPEGLRDFFNDFGAKGWDPDMTLKISGQEYLIFKREKVG